MKKTKKKTKAKKAMKKSCKKCKRGFTLIELLVVVAIIGILAGIVVISTNSARQRTLRASLLSSLASVATTARVCTNEDGTVVAPGAGNENGAAAGDEICSLTDINEEWPTLPTDVQNANLRYGTANDTTLTGVDTSTEPDTVVVTCDVTTASCRYGS